MKITKRQLRRLIKETVESLGFDAYKYYGEYGARHGREAAKIKLSDDLDELGLMFDRDARDTGDMLNSLAQEDIEEFEAYKGS
jgi:hypothetical protein